MGVGSGDPCHVYSGAIRDVDDPSPVGSEEGIGRGVPCFNDVRTRTFETCRHGRALRVLGSSTPEQVPGVPERLRDSCDSAYSHDRDHPRRTPPTGDRGGPERTQDDTRCPDPLSTRSHPPVSPGESSSPPYPAPATQPLPTRE